MAAERALDGLGLERVRGFVFDVDGTLVHRGPDGRARPQPGATEVLARIRASGRPLVLFTNGSHVPSAGIARGLREDGLEIADDEMLTPTDSAISYLNATHRHRRVHLFGSEAIAARMRAAGVALAENEDAEAVYVAHLGHIDVEELERGARAVLRQHGNEEIADRAQGRTPLQEWRHVERYPQEENRQQQPRHTDALFRRVVERQTEQP